MELFASMYPHAAIALAQLASSFLVWLLYLPFRRSGNATTIAAFVLVTLFVISFVALAWVSILLQDWRLFLSGLLLILFVSAAFLVSVLRLEKNTQAHDVLEAVSLTYLTHALKTGGRFPALEEDNIDKSYPEFCLFLRPFYLEKIDATQFGNSNPFEELLELDVKIQLGLPMLAIGNAVAFGGGRVGLPKDADWQQVALMLMHAADVIVICPSLNEGTKWELAVCLEYFLSKTIFFAPSASGTWSHDPAVQRAADDIQMIAAGMSELGFETPSSFDDDFFWSYAGGSMMTANKFDTLCEQLGWGKQTFARTSSSASV
jgi:hypothetical protein